MSVCHMPERQWSVPSVSSPLSGGYTAESLVYLLGWLRMLLKHVYFMYNFLRWKVSDDEVNECQANVPAEEQPAVQHLSRMGSNNTSREALSVRATYTTYFSSPAGAVPWQYTAM